MPRHTLFAYANGSDLDGVAFELATRFDIFLSSRAWISGRAWLVNQRAKPDDLNESVDLPDWDLGLNLELPDLGSEPPQWFEDVEVVCPRRSGPRTGI